MFLEGCIFDQVTTIVVRKTKKVVGHKLFQMFYSFKKIITKQIYSVLKKMTV